MKLSRKVIATAGLVIGLVAGIAGFGFGQSANQIITTLLGTDLVQIYGRTSATEVFAALGSINNVTKTTKVSPGQAALGGTGYSNTFSNNQGYLVFVLPGTMPYSYVTLAASPPDGAKQCVFAGGGAITALYVSANVGQSIANAATTLSSNSGQCFTYSLSNTTWDRSN